MHEIYKPCSDGIFMKTTLSKNAYLLGDIGGINMAPRKKSLKQIHKKHEDILKDLEAIKEEFAKEVGLLLIDDFDILDLKDYQFFKDTVKYRAKMMKRYGKSIEESERRRIEKENAEKQTLEKSDDKLL